MNVPKFVDASFKNHWNDKLSNEHYHSITDAVSSSGVRDALVSPLKFYRRYVLNERDAPSKSMQLGTLVHLALLEPERFRYLYKIIPDFGPMQSSKNREKRDAWLKDQPSDCVVVTDEDYKKSMRMIESVMAFNGGMIAKMLEGSVFEKSGFFRDPVTGLQCRMRPDAIREDLSLLVDIKTTRDCSREAFARSIWQYAYHCQLAFYSMGVKEIHGRYPTKACFITVENNGVFDCAVYEASEAMLDKGMEAVRRGLDSLANAIKSDNWPGCQPDGAEVLDLPAFTDNLLEGA